MSIILLLITPLIGLIFICSNMHYSGNINTKKVNSMKYISLMTSIVTLLISLFIFIFFHFSSNHFQFIQNASITNTYNMSFGIDGTSIYFVLLTTIIMPISLLSNWNSITEKIKAFSVIILLLETLLLSIFLVLDSLLFYVFFESILPPLFILIGIFGSANRVRASFYLFLYTLLGSLFMLLSILKISSLAGYTQYDAVYKSNFIYYLQLFMFTGIFIAFAVKTPTIFLNSWLLKAHVESPLSGSIILAAIVLKLSLYGILRLMLPLLAKASIVSTKLVYVIGFITIIYGSASTIRTVDVKELIAYSSVCHAAVYLMGVFSNVVTGIEGGIVLGLAHGFVSSGLFICVGGVLYDRTSTRLISIYRGMAQLMPVFSILLFILCLGNCGAPLTLNFIGEFMSLYGIFERHLMFAPLASLSIILSAVYTIYLFNRIAFAGSYSKDFIVNIPDVNKREFYILFTLVAFTVILGVYPAPILDAIHYSTSTLIYSTPALLITSSVYLGNHLKLKPKLYLNALFVSINRAYESLKWGLYNSPEPIVPVQLESRIINFDIKTMFNSIINVLYKICINTLFLTCVRYIIKILFGIDVLNDLYNIISLYYYIISVAHTMFINKIINKHNNPYFLAYVKCFLQLLTCTLIIKYGSNALLNIGLFSFISSELLILHVKLVDTMHNNSTFKDQSHSKDNLLNHNLTLKNWFKGLMLLGASDSEPDTKHINYCMTKSHDSTETSKDSGSGYYSNTGGDRKFSQSQDQPTGQLQGQSTEQSQGQSNRRVYHELNYFKDPVWKRMAIEALRLRDNQKIQDTPLESTDDYVSDEDFQRNQDAIFGQPRRDTHDARFKREQNTTRVDEDDKKN